MLLLLFWLIWPLETSSFIISRSFWSIGPLLAVEEEELIFKDQELGLGLGSSVRSVVPAADIDICCSAGLFWLLGGTDDEAFDDNDDIVDDDFGLGGGGGGCFWLVDARWDDDDDDDDIDDEDDADVDAALTLEIASVIDSVRESASRLGFEGGFIFATSLFGTMYKIRNCFEREYKDEI